MSEEKKLEQLLSQGKITRREFLARASALGLTAALSPALLTRSTHAATPKKGGRLRLGMAGGSTTDSLDPATMTDAMAMSINWQARNCLVEVSNFRLGNCIMIGEKNRKIKGLSHFFT